MVNLLKHSGFKGTLISTTAETHEVANVWKKCAEDVWKSEQDMVANWKEDLDNLLVFVSLKFFLSVSCADPFILERAQY